MAEAILKSLVKKQGLENTIKVDSAGTGDWHVGNPPHKGTQEILQKNNISTQGLIARQMNKNDSKYDYIIAMDERNKENIVGVLGSKHQEKVFKLLDLVEEAVDKNVPDPYFTGNFEEVFELVIKGCNNLLNKIMIENNLTGGQQYGEK
jgi:protein-tyrosine phosphatase